ncbi:MAG: complex I NDUFA9 subunit family protein [Candidatus Thiodiazotropha lotti]|nr:complex I NDUFA9 subunit family protein [Candidatus Thiodiazotropha lotti]
MNRICILGGSGFVGHRLVSVLSKRGYPCRLLSRHPQRHAGLKVYPGVELVKVTQFDSPSLQQHFAGCQSIINLIGILNETNKASFMETHVALVDQIVEAAIKSGATRLLHMSALHADAGKGSSEYLRSKGEGENRAHTHGGSALTVTSFRPSVIFGPGDGLFNRFASLLSLSPGIFPLASPDSRFAPVYVGDVAEAFARALEDSSTSGAHYDLCGPEVYSLKELVRYCARQLGLRRLIVPLNPSLSRLQARLLGLLPGKPFTMDNYLSLQTDSVCKNNGLLSLGISPQSIQSHVPRYLADQGYRKRFDRYRQVVE